MRHGEIHTKDDHQRWCTFHKGYHGYLYPCERFKEGTLLEIVRLDEENRQKWTDREFIQGQLDKGMPQEGVIIMQMFAGVRV